MPWWLKLTTHWIARLLLGSALNREIGMVAALRSLAAAVFVILNTLRPRQNGRHFADDTFKHIFLNENVRISIKISLKFVPKGPFNNNSALVQIMAWRRPGDKPLFEPMMVRSLTHICVTRPRWVKLTTTGTAVTIFLPREQVIVPVKN